MLVSLLIASSSLMADGMPTWHQPVAKASHKLKFLNSLTRQKVSIIKALANDCSYWY